MNEHNVLQDPRLSGFLDRVVALPDFQGIKPVAVDEQSILGDTLLHFAARWGDVEAGKLLLGAGAEPNAAGEYGNTPLHDAVGQKKYEFVRLLLAHGASREHRNDDGLTPVDLIRTSNDPRLKEIFS